MEGRGKKIGVPTANLDFSQKRITPKRGVYITQTKIGDMIYNSVTNIGINPTFNDNSLSSVETHLLEFDLDIYGEELEVRFIKRIRDEQKFDSVNLLITQIKNDIETAKAHFKC